MAAKKGQKRTPGSGRVKGTPNRQTVERLEKERIAQQMLDEVNKAYAERVKLGKDVLEDYMMTFHSVAVPYRDRVTEAITKGRKPAELDLAGLEKWGGLTVKTAKDLAEFQSPKFKAIQVSAPSHPDPAALIPVNANDKQIDDPVALARVYQKMVKQVGVK
jgi:hypothetical protein